MLKNILFYKKQKESIMFNKIVTLIFIACSCFILYQGKEVLSILYILIAILFQLKVIEDKMK